MNVYELGKQLEEGLVTSEQLTRAALRAIEANDNQLDCLVTSCEWITSFAAVRGTCSMVIPAVKFDPEHYQPISYFMVGKPFEEEKLIQLAYTLQEALQLENRPAWCQEDIWAI